MLNKKNSMATGWQNSVDPVRNIQFIANKLKLNLIKRLKVMLRQKCSLHQDKILITHTYVTEAN